MKKWCVFQDLNAGIRGDQNTPFFIIYLVINFSFKEITLHFFFKFLSIFTILTEKNNVDGSEFMLLF